MIRALLLLLLLPSFASAQSFLTTVQPTLPAFPVVKQVVKEAKPLPVWLDARYRYPNWTYPGSIYDHLFDEPHHSILQKAGYTDKQLRSISVREAELLHNHLHNYFGASAVDYGSVKRGIFAVQSAST